jgi:NAD(P)-dependent dehydrogenase (short-subunit alcohol dehydrogenase family)
LRRVLITQEDGRATFIAADASNASDVQKVIDHAISTFGRLDMIVNNAGVLTVEGAFTAR